MRVTLLIDGTTIVKLITMAPWQQCFGSGAADSGSWVESVMLDTFLGNWNQIYHIIITRITVWIGFLWDAVLDHSPGEILREASAQQDTMVRYFTAIAVVWLT